MASLRGQFEARWRAAETPEQKTALREEIFAALTRDQLEYAFLMAVAEDNEVAADRLHEALLEREHAEYKQATLARERAEAARESAHPLETLLREMIRRVGKSALEASGIAAPEAERASPDLMTPEELGRALAGEQRFTGQRFEARAVDYILQSRSAASRRSSRAGWRWPRGRPSIDFSKLAIETDPVSGEIRLDLEHPRELLEGRAVLGEREAERQILVEAEEQGRPLEEPRGVFNLLDEIEATRVPFPPDAVYVDLGICDHNLHRVACGWCQVHQQPIRDIRLTSVLVASPLETVRMLPPNSKILVESDDG